MEILDTLGQLGRDFANLGRELKLYPLLLSALLPAVWIAWWLWAVNWRKAFPALVQGAWVPLLLLMLVSSLVWSRIAPSNLDLGFMQLYNFWWQFGAVGILIGIALLCGWLQLYFGLTPPEFNFDPPSGHDDGHDAHAHESAHAHH